MSKPLDANHLSPKNCAGFMYCQRPTKKRLAAQIMDPAGFKIRTAAGIQQLGEMGDYLIIDERGNKEVCPKDQFTNEYVLTMEGDFELNEFEKLVQASPLPLVNDEEGYKVYVAAIQDLLDGVPGRIFLRKIESDGSTYEIEYAYEQVNTVEDAKEPDTAVTMADPTAALIAEGGGQTHDQDD
jgi:hypothetical protein